jgi:hypothetical protein
MSACSGGSSSDAPTPLRPGTAPTSTSTGSKTAAGAAVTAAIEAVERMYSEFNLSLRSGDTRRFRATFTRDCGVCLTDAHVTDGIRARGETIHGGGYRLTDVQVVDKESGFLIVQGTISEPATVVKKGNRIVAKQDALPPTSFIWHVVAVSGSYLVASSEALK